MRRARRQATLARVGLSAFADAYPRELSGGMKMRVVDRAGAGHRAERCC